MITIKELDKNIWGIWEFYHFEKVISYLIVWEKSAVLFDTWMWIFDIKDIVKSITNLPIIVINSHHHFDHIWWNSFFDNIFIFDDELIKLSSENWVSRKLIESNYKDEHFYKKPTFFEIKNFEIKPFKYTKLLKSWDIIDISPFKFKVIYTPWHSKDHICLYELNKWYLFSGDLLYNWSIYINDKIKFFNSLKEIKKLYLSNIFAWHNEFLFDINILDKILLSEKTIISKKNYIFNNTYLIFNDFT